MCDGKMRGEGFYNTATRPYVCLSVLVFPTRLSDSDQIGYAYANRSWNGFNLKQFDPLGLPTPGGEGGGGVRGSQIQ